MTTTSDMATRPISIDRHTSEAVRKRRTLTKVITYFCLTLAGLMFAFPLYWTVSSSLQTWQELRSFTPHLWPATPQWHNYADVFQTVPFARWMANSFLIVFITIPGTIITATLTAYAFARFNFVGKNVWFILMLGTMMIPGTVTLIPQYLLWFKLKLINTYVPLTIGSWLGGSAFMIFLLRQFILSIPRDLDEAALIDGAGPFRILWSVIVPLMKPALTTVAILQFLNDWNEFFAPFIYLNRAELFTAAVGLRYFQYIPLETNDPRDHLLMAAAAVMTIPVIALFAAAQRYFISGVVLSGLKL
ncbi:carbohydrate ABC transporter permease [Litorilinea aerophila]|uniref:Carbohydrate ABC transporter permease n=1 Tax=Litorilinea aerophila TaxID=1204385 RepID=A0A540VCG1_9CHLR|nr:carbohydrate ABC transporter permease [Litorilinea aerophila]MCC9077788.1 carbohydrate ABC transporter permease [Litorilinea aerophila]GIV79021.1 MAG: sugar ABC transporter permease [Litorilinea sp.]